MANGQINIGIGVTANTQQAKQQFMNLQQSLQALVIQGSRTDIMANTKLSMKQAVQAAKELQMHLANAYNQKTGQLDLVKLNTSLKASGQSIQQYSQQLLQGGQLGQQAFRNLATQITATKAPVGQLTGMVKGLATTFMTAMKYQISYGAINAVINGVRQAISFTKELNTALTDVRVVTGMTAAESDKLARSANQMAKTLKSTTKDIVQGQLIYLQQGDSVELAAKKAEITTKAANVAFTANQQQMSEYLTAIWNSYQVGSNELELFVDKIAAVGAATATSMEEMATAMTKVAATANAVGVTYDQLNATIATISSVTRTGSETVGTALKTIYARIGDLKLGKEDEDGLGLGQVSSQLKSVGIDILDETDNLQDMGEVVEEIGDKWQGWSEAQQTAVAQAIAGKRQYTQLIALFENWDMYKDTLAVSEGASGTLDKQQKIWSESWEAASNRVKAAQESLYQGLLNDDVFIKFTDTIYYLLEGIGSFTRVLGGIPGILALVFTYLMQIRGVAIVDAMQRFGASARQAFGQTKNDVNELKSGLEGVLAKIKGGSFNTEMKTWATSMKEVLKVQQHFIANEKNMTLAQKQQYQIGLQEMEALNAQMHENINTTNLLTGELEQLGGTSSKIIQIRSALPTMENILRSTNGFMKLKSAIDQVTVEAKEFYTDQEKLNGVMKLADNSLNKNSAAYKQLKSEVQQGKVSFETFAMVEKELITGLKQNDAAIDKLVNSFNLGEQETKEFKAILMQLRQQLEQNDITNEEFEASAKKIIATMDQAGTKAQQTASKLQAWGSTFSTMSMGVSSINMLGDAFISMADGSMGLSQGLDMVISGLSMIMIMLPMLKSLAATNPFTFWLVIITEVVAIFIKLAEHFEWFKSEEEKVNKELEETKQKIQELKTAVTEYKDELDKLQKKRLSANKQESADLDRQIAQKTMLLELGEQELENATQLEKSLKAKQAKIKIEKLRNNIEIKATTKSKDGFSYDVQANFTQKEYEKLARGETVTKNGKSYNGLYQQPNSVNILQTPALKASKSVQEYKNQMQIVNDTNSDYTEIQEAEAKATEARINTIKEFSEIIAYAAEEELPNARMSIVSELNVMYGDIEDEGERFNAILTDLYSIDPTAFDSVDELWEKYEAYFTMIGMGKLDVEAFWKAYDVQGKNATREIEKVRTSTSKLIKSLKQAQEILSSDDNEDGWLSIETIDEFINGFETLGDQAEEFRKKLIEANGNTSKMKDTINEIVNFEIQNKVASGVWANSSLQEIEAYLREANVIDASTVALKIYNTVKAQSEAKAINYTGNLDEEAGALMAIVQKYGEASGAALSYYMTEVLLARTDIGVADKISQINKLIEAYSTLTGVSLSATAMMGIQPVYTYTTGSQAGEKTLDMIPGETSFSGEYYYDGKYYSSLADAASAVGRSLIKIPHIKTANPEKDKETPGKKMQDEFDRLRQHQQDRTITTFKDKNGNEVTRRVTMGDLDAYIEQMIYSGHFTPEEINELRSQRSEWWDEVGDYERQERERAEQIEEFTGGVDNANNKTTRAIENLTQSKNRLNEKLRAYADGAPFTREEEAELISQIISDTNDVINSINEETEELVKNGEAYIEYSNVFGYNVNDNEIRATERIFQHRYDGNQRVYQERIKSIDEIAKIESKTEEEIAEMRKDAYEQYYADQKAIDIEHTEWQREQIHKAAEYELEQWKETQERKKAELEAEKTVTEGLHESLNSIREAQHEINKELQTSLTQYQYLDKETRKLLFNTDDYLELSEELTSIQKQASKLAREYNNKILGKTEEEIEHITAEYERQNEMLMKQYEIKKAELEVEKKRLALNNVLNERNTQMFIDGQWQWVADTKAIADAQQALLDAEYERDTATIEKQQQKAIDRLDSAINDLDLEIAKAERAFEDLCETLDGDKKYLDSILKGFGNNITSISSLLVDEISNITGKDYDYNISIPDEALNPNEKDMSGALGYLYSNATGTDNAFGGISRINEKGLELLATKYGGQFIELNPGDKVFNHDQFDFLYKFSKNPFSLLNGLSNSQSVDNSIRIGNFEITGNSEEGEALRSILTRILGNH